MSVQPILSMQFCSDCFLLLFLCVAATSADRFYRIDRSQVNPYSVLVSIGCFFFLKLCHMQLKMNYLPFFLCIAKCYSWCLMRSREKNSGLFFSWSNSHCFTEVLYLLTICHSVHYQSDVRIRIFCNCFPYRVLLGASVWYQCICIYHFTDVFTHQKTWSCVCAMK